MRDSELIMHKSHGSLKVLILREEISVRFKGNFYSIKLLNVKDKVLFKIQIIISKKKKKMLLDNLVMKDVSNCKLNSCKKVLILHEQSTVSIL